MTPTSMFWVDIVFHSMLPLHAQILYSMFIIRSYQQLTIFQIYLTSIAVSSEMQHTLHTINVTFTSHTCIIFLRVFSSQLLRTIHLSLLRDCSILSMTSVKLCWIDLKCWSDDTHKSSILILNVDQMIHTSHPFLS